MIFNSIKFFNGYAAKMQIRQMSIQLANLAGNNELDLEDATWISPKRGMNFPFQPLAMSFENVK